MVALERRSTVEDMRRKSPEPLRITSASRPRSEDIRGRERRYLISMGIRTLCFVLGVLLMGHWYMWLFLGASIFLPYVAVVIANAGANPDPGGSEFAYDPDLRAIGEGPAFPAAESRES